MFAMTVIVVCSVFNLFHLWKSRQWHLAGLAAHKDAQRELELAMFAYDLNTRIVRAYQLYCQGDASALVQLMQEEEFPN
jgi:hypothetical protein